MQHKVRCQMAPGALDYCTLLERGARNCNRHLAIKINDLRIGLTSLSPRHERNMLGHQRRIVCHALLHKLIIARHGCACAPG